MVQIITDSSPLYHPEEGKKLGFEVVPLCVNIGEFEGRDLLVDMNEFYDRIKKGGYLMQMHFTVRLCVHTHRYEYRNKKQQIDKQPYHCQYFSKETTLSKSLRIFLRFGFRL